MLLYQIALTKLPAVGNVTAKRLLSIFGNAKNIFDAKPKELKELGFNKAVLEALKKNNALKESENELKFIEKNNITTFFYTDSEYPYRLKFCDDGPILIYYKGNVNLNYARIISIVGTRKMTEYGSWICRKIIEELSNFQVLIVSGLAYGVDTAAHEAAIEFKLPTIGITAHGHDTLYPATNRKLAKQMMNNGGILTEFPSNTIPDRENFPRRNRIIAGMSDATLVIEAGSKGGALITADIADSYGRDVFAIPGRVNDMMSVGCNNLIRTNRAISIQNAQQIVNIMNWDAVKEKNRQTELFNELSDDELTVAKILSEKGESGIDFIIENSQLSATNTASALLSLEFKNIVICLPGKRYKLN